MYKRLYENGEYKFPVIVTIINLLPISNVERIGNVVSVSRVS
jgi:hypothetical protein